ncbi:hypothetical protein TK90_2725 (plasmid) [Thioalkalivibrio sp. K90mix]|uniref:hypothetical protein n=1 Tax=Thioalkalivibrio sp. (strain K90mix) TaxID=396595 RepID=UPI000195A4DC|nr:hypothetical protein [Thioalkalivibrio sp. K90mix]ADC73211.1 hypothetical protein TK90_2725 [Thioalkalivibrio sp. K90mix]
MSTFEYREESGHSETIPNVQTMVEAREVAEEWLKDGDWGVERKTLYAEATVFEKEEDEDGEETILDQATVHARIDPDEPDCREGEHDWCSPYELLGGLKENPGVQGHGGGIISTEVCAHCGMYRVTNTWDQSQGPEPVDTVEYRDADDASLEWAAERAIRNASDLDVLVEALAERYDDTSERFQERGLVDLPNFGGDETEDTRGIWSWDETRLLIGEGDPDEWQVVTREDWERGEI